MNNPSLHIDQIQPKWFAIRTQFRKEKYVVKNLLKKGIEAYTPIQKILRRYTSKNKWVELPLLANYAFVKITRKEYSSIFETQGFLSFVNFSGTLVSISEKEIEILKHIVEEEEILNCSTEDFTLGDWVEIKSGQLAGMKGRLVEEKGKRGFVVQFDRLGIYLTIAVEHHLLRKIEAA